MNFASPYVFNNAAEKDDYEAVSDEEFLGGMELSDSDSEEESEDARRAGSPPPPPPLSTLPSARPGGGDAGGAPPSRPPSMMGRMMGFLGMGGGSAPPAPVPPTYQNLDPAPPLPPRWDSLAGRKGKGKMHHWKSMDRSATEPVMPGGGKQGKRRVFRRADTNVVSLRFDTLKTPSAMHAGEVIRCPECGAIMSHVSVLDDDGPDKVWGCEFCNSRNVVDVEDEEKPTAADVTYLIQPALVTTASGTTGRDESMVIFCIDTSGSMTITTEVPGQQQLRGTNTLRRLRRENTFEGNQYMPSERRNVTYISRLQAVQAAVDHQLGEMAREFPHRRVALVTFSYEVHVIGDGNCEETVVSGQKLTDQAELTRIGADLPTPNSIKDTRHALAEKVFQLEEGGSTALGPALIVALGMASKHPGSKVIVCTDGKSNEGVGKVENLADSDPDPADFYEGVAKTANENGVSISVVTIKGTDCKLIQLGKLADNTGGQVNIVDPLKLTEEFSNVLADRIIATSVVATFILHRGLYIGKEENEASKEKRTVGNVRADHEISFEYGVRKGRSKETQKSDSLDSIKEVSTSTEAGGESAGAGPSCHGDSEGLYDNSIPSELPFQLQIAYTDIDGTQALRVLTQKKPVTTDRNVAEKDADLNVLGVHTERKASELALEGDYSGSRAVALMNQRLGWRASRSSGDRSKKKLYRKAFSRVQTVENKVTAKQMSELQAYGRTHSDSEEDTEECMEVVDSAGQAPLGAQGANKLATKTSVRGASIKKMLTKKMRSEDVDDDMAECMYQSRSSSTAYMDRSPTS